GSLRAPLSLAAGAATAAEAASRAAAVVLNTAEAFRRTDLLRTLVQKPDVCKPTTCDQEIETWSDWKHGLKNYLSVVDAKYVEEMDVIENNGYEVWRALTMEMQPSSRQRQLALVAQLSTVRFDPAKSLSEQVTRYEEIIAEYERISSLQFSEDLKITTLVQAAPAALQVQLHMSLNSETTYAKLREQLLAYERRDAKGKKGKEGKLFLCAPDFGEYTFYVYGRDLAESYRAVRRVRMVTPPHVPSCVVYDISEDTLPTEDQDLDEDEYYAARAVRFERGTAQGSRDPSDEETATNTQIILDTGADASMVPEIMRELVAAVPSSSPRLCHAQGNAVPTHSLRQKEFWLRDAEGNACCIREVCVVGSPIHHTPVKFKNNSLAVAGEIRAITEVPRTLPPQVPKVTLTEEMQGLVGKEGLHVLADGTKFHYTVRASHLLDARPWYDPNLFKARTTLFQSTSGQWLQVENSADYVNEPNPFTLANSHPKPRITMVPPKPSEELLRLYPQPMRCRRERYAAQVHVDGVMATGDAEPQARVEKNLTYTVKIAGPYQRPGDEFEFLKRRCQIQSDGSRCVPRCGFTDGVFATDATEELNPREATAYRTMLGHEADQALGWVPLDFARGKLTPDEPIAEHLVEGYSDSNFANDRTARKSLSSGQIYIDQALMYSFVRGQKVVTLSSGEAELVALTQTTSEAILAHKAWVWTTQEEARLVMRSDSSVARAIASRLGVGCCGHDGQTAMYLEAVLFYFLEVFYNNPVFFLAALLTYVLVTSRWPNKQPEPKETRSPGEPSREPETLEEAKRRLHETLTYEDLFSPKPGLEQAMASASGLAASASSSTTRFSEGRTEARVALSVQRHGFLECATKCLTGHDLDSECWVTEFGYAYHRRSCGNMKHAKNVKKTTAREAIEMGKAACNQCFADHWACLQGPWCHKPDDGGARATVTEPAGEKNKVKTTSRPFADYVRFETKEGLALLYDPTPLDKWIGKDYIWDSKNKLQMDPKTGEVLTDLQQRRVKTFDASCNGTKRGVRPELRHGKKKEAKDKKKKKGKKEKKAEKDKHNTPDAGEPTKKNNVQQDCTEAGDPVQEVGWGDDDNEAAFCSKPTAATDMGGHDIDIEDAPDTSSPEAPPRENWVSGEQ
ncbi:unnamed protein product, partial [Symbiodinium sp. KB8]